MLSSDLSNQFVYTWRKNKFTNLIFKTISRVVKILIITLLHQNEKNDKPDVIS